MSRKLQVVLRTMAVSMTIAMLYYFAGYRIVYSFVIHDAKEDADFAIHHEAPLTKMTFSVSEYNELKWTEKGKEFSLNKQFYDVVSIQKSGNTYTMEVYSDENETRWVEAMNDFINFIFRTDTNKTNHAESLLSAFQKEYTLLSKIKVAYIPDTKNIFYSYNSTSYSVLLIKPIWHPPASC